MSPIPGRAAIFTAYSGGARVTEHTLPAWARSGSSKVVARHPADEKAAAALSVIHNTGTT